MQQQTTKLSAFYQSYYDQTTLHPLAGLSILVLGVLTLCLARRNALIPTLILICFVSTAQRVVIFGLDFTLLRIMVIFGMVRLLLRGELRMLRWQAPDHVILAWAFVTGIAYTLHRGTSDSAIFILGYMYDALGLYFMVRCLVRDWNDVQSMARSLVFISVLVAIVFLNEKATGRNLFSVFGAVPEETQVREGRLRCQGAFPHPILAGCFWASLMPYMGALWFGRQRLLAVTGLACGLVIVITSASSTPVASLLLGSIAAASYFLRYQMTYLRYAAVLVLVGLHLVMNHPVWHLLARVDLSGGSTGWHRFLLVDETIRRFPEWALLGTDTAYWTGGLHDVTNQYIVAAVQGGLIGLCLFLLMIAMAFSRVGVLWRAAGKDKARSTAAWALGVALFIHAANFIGVSYFGQVVFAWYAALAIIVSLSGDSLAPRRQRPQRAPPELARRFSPAQTTATD